MKKNLRRMVFSALLIALGVIFARILKTPITIIPGAYVLRVSLGYIPVIFSSLLLGPVSGAVIGVLTDLIGFFAFPEGFPYFFGYTITLAVVGFIPGLFKNLIKRFKWTLPIVVLITSVIASIMNSFWFEVTGAARFSVVVWPRLLDSLIMSIVYSVALFALMRVLELFEKEFIKE